MNEDLIKNFMDRVSAAPKKDGRYQYPYVELEPIDNFKNYGHETGLFQDVERVRVAKVLRLVCEKKKNN